MGIGMALLEHTSYDPQNGARSIATWPITWWPVNADVAAPNSTCISSISPTKKLTNLAHAALAKIGLAGIAAAITDAVHHATGVRVRELPVKMRTCWREASYSISFQKNSNQNSGKIGIALQFDTCCILLTWLH